MSFKQRGYIRMETATETRVVHRVTTKCPNCGRVDVCTETLDPAEAERVAVFEQGLGACFRCEPSVSYQGGQHELEIIRVPSE
jgi:hypothetical protein